MQVKPSEFLLQHKPLLKKLVDSLSKYYGYVSILGTDTKGTTYRINKMGVDVRDYAFVERGFVVRVHNGTNYSEFSFNELKEENLDEIIANIRENTASVIKGVDVNSYPVIQEEEIERSFLSEVEENPEEIGSEQIISDFIKIRDEALALSDLVVNFAVIYNYIHVSKIFISPKKDLFQSYMTGEGVLASYARRDDKFKYYYSNVSGMHGYEMIKKLKDRYPMVVDMSIKLLDAKSVEPGEYEVICNPDITGLIAHEAFGHGVEMDMFVKERAKGAEYIGKRVASDKTTMHDGAVGIKQSSSYLFDDEGTLGTDTVIIKNGILQTGISDLLSAMKLGTTPTGNGKRQTFERKAYSRMTNTYFEPGTDSYEDILASIKYGYQLETLYSGMEDPKNWGMQCIALLGREIVNGKFTGNIISPVVITGFVPEILESFQMLSPEMGMEGGGFCGKGYKEYVKTSQGGPFIKAKVRLG